LPHNSVAISSIAAAGRSGSAIGLQPMRAATHVRAMPDRAMRRCFVAHFFRIICNLSGPLLSEVGALLPK
jgi:hypothetical protein